MSAFRYKKIKIHEHDVGDMTKIAPMPHMVKTLQKSSSPATGGPISTKFGM